VARGAPPPTRPTEHVSQMQRGTAAAACRDCPKMSAFPSLPQSRRMPPRRRTRAGLRRFAAGAVSRQAEARARQRSTTAACILPRRRLPRVRPAQRTRSNGGVRDVAQVSAVRKSPPSPARSQHKALPASEYIERPRLAGHFRGLTAVSQSGVSEGACTGIGGSGTVLGTSRGARPSRSGATA